MPGWIFGREQTEATGLLPELKLCSGRGGERDFGGRVGGEAAGLAATGSVDELQKGGVS